MKSLSVLAWPSLAVSRMVSVLVLAGGLPLKVRLLALKFSQLGRLLPSLSLALTVRASPSASLTALQGMLKLLLPSPLKLWLLTVPQPGARLRLTTSRLKEPQSCSAWRLSDAHQAL